MQIVGILFFAFLIAPRAQASCTLKVIYPDNEMKSFFIDEGLSIIKTRFDDKKTRCMVGPELKTQEGGNQFKARYVSCYRGNFTFQSKTVVANFAKEDDTSLFVSEGDKHHRFLLKCTW